MSDCMTLRCATCNNDDHDIPDSHNGSGLRELALAAPHLKQLWGTGVFSADVLTIYGDMCGNIFDIGWLVTHADHELVVVSEYGPVVWSSKEQRALAPAEEPTPEWTKTAPRDPDWYWAIVAGEQEPRPVELFTFEYDCILYDQSELRVRCYTDGEPVEGSSLSAVELWGPRIKRPSGPVRAEAPQKPLGPGDIVMPASVVLTAECSLCGRYSRASVPDGCGFTFEIRRLKVRLVALQSSAREQAAAAVQGDQTFGDITLRVANNRVQILFPGKPAEEVRRELKRNGFRWAPSEGAWQRLHNFMAQREAERIAKKFGVL